MGRVTRCLSLLPSHLPEAASPLVCGDSHDRVTNMVVPPSGSLIACRTWGSRNYYPTTGALHTVQFKPYPLLAYWDRPDMNGFITQRNHSRARSEKLIVSRSLSENQWPFPEGAQVHHNGSPALTVHAYLLFHTPRPRTF